MLENRTISSSEDRCKCSLCQLQQDPKQLSNYTRSMACNIFIYKHLKKRQGPPIKKEINSKDISRKIKLYSRKDDHACEQNQYNKHHKIQQTNKCGLSPSIFIEYHQVSHSQRFKLMRSDELYLGQKKGMAQDMRNRIRDRNKGLPQTHRLIQICQNPQNIRPMRNLSSQCSKEIHASPKQENNSLRLK